MILATARSLTTATATQARGESTTKFVPPGHTPDVRLNVDAELRRALVGQVRAALGVKIQITGLDPLYADDLVGSVRVTLTERGLSWSFAVPVSRGGVTPLGTIRAGSGGRPPWGDNNVSIMGRVVTASGVHEAPLVTRGLTHQGRLSASRDGVVYEVSGVGPSGRLDRWRVSHNVPAGSGRRRSQVIQDALDTIDSSGVLASISGASRIKLRRPLQALEEPPVEWARRLLEAEGLGLRDDSDGTLRIEPTGWRPATERPRWGTVQDVIDYSETESADRPGVVTVRATITSPEDSDECDIKTTVEVTTIRALHQTRRYEFQQLQGLSSTLVAGPGPAAETLQIIERVTVIEERECGVLISRTTVTEEPFNPRTARYQLEALETTRTIGAYEPCYLFEADATDDDNTVGHLWPAYRLTRTSILTERHRFQDGVEVETVEERRAWQIQGRAAKRRSSISSATWESLDYTDGSGLNPRDLGDGTLVAPPLYRDDFRLVERKTTTLITNDSLQLEAEQSELESYTHVINKPGSFHHLWPDGVSGDGSDFFQPDGRQVKIYVGAGEGGRQELEFEFDGAGRKIREVRTGALPGYRPATPIQYQLVQDLTAPGTSDSTDSTPPGEAQEVEHSERCAGTVSAAAGFEDVAEIVTLAHADTADEVREHAVRLAQEACSRGVQVTVLPLWGLEPNDWPTVDPWELGLDGETVRVEEVTHAWSPDGITSQVAVVLYED